jgi:peptide/nickel transport system permease protein
MPHPQDRNRAAEEPLVNYIGIRLLQTIPALLGVTLVAFVLLQISGDVTGFFLAPEASEEQRAAFRRAHGLDQPVLVQYVYYVGGLLRGDFGRSFVHQRPAMDVVLDRFSATLELTAAALLIGVSLALPAGVLAAVKRDSVFDRLVTIITVLGQSIPTFWLGMLLILLFAVYLQVLPVSGRGTLAQLVLPSVALAMWPLTIITRLTRSGMLDVLSQDYIRTARAKGLRESAVTARHALRNALVPIVTVLGVNMGAMLGGAVLTETVFAWPGIGTLTMSAVLSRDYPVVLAGLVLVAGCFITINLAVDILYGFLDPRIRLSHGR